MKPMRSGNHRARPIDENLNRVIPARASSLLVTFNDNTRARNDRNFEMDGRAKPRLSRRRPFSLKRRSGTRRVKGR